MNSLYAQWTLPVWPVQSTWLPLSGTLLPYANQALLVLPMPPPCTILPPWFLSRKDSVLPSLHLRKYFMENKSCICPFLSVLQLVLFTLYSKMWNTECVHFPLLQYLLYYYIHQTRELASCVSPWSKRRKNPYQL